MGLNAQFNVGRITEIGFYWAPPQLENGTSQKFRRHQTRESKYAKKD